MAADVEVQRLVSGNDIETPQSILKIQNMIRYAKRYLKEVEGIKSPGSVSRFYLGSSKISMNQLGLYRHLWDLCPYIGIDYDRCMMTSGDEIRFNPKYEDILKLTVCHELFHHHQSSYALYSWMKCKTVDEATASALERYYARWLYDNHIIRNNPDDKAFDGKFEFVDRSKKEWLFNPLDNAIVLPTTMTITLLRNAAMSLYGDMVNFWKSPSYTMDKARDAVIDIITALYGTGFANMVIRDMMGITEAIGENNANCERGYVLGGVIEKLSEKYGPRKLHAIMTYGTGYLSLQLHFWNLADAFKKAFNIDDEALYQCYEEFCKDNIMEIVNQQDKFMQPGQRGEEFYYGQLFKPSYELSTSHYKQKLFAWNRSGMFACRTVRLKGLGDYSMFLVPHSSRLPQFEKAVKAYVLVGDSLFSPTPYYVEYDEVNRKSPISVAFMFTDDMKEFVTLGTSTLSENDYYTAVAFYGPQKAPKFSVFDTGTVNITHQETLPPIFKDFQEWGTTADGLSKNKYGVAYTVRNNKTGREATTPIELWHKDKVETSISIRIPDFVANEKPDVSVYARWFYQPNIDNNDVYYSPKIEGEGGRLEGVLLDGDFLITDGFFSEAHVKGHLMLTTEKFVITIPDQPVSWDKDDGYYKSHYEGSLSGLTIEGKCKVIKWDEETNGRHLSREVVCDGPYTVSPAQWDQKYTTHTTYYAQIMQNKREYSEDSYQYFLEGTYTPSSEEDMRVLFYGDYYTISVKYKAKKCIEKNKDVHYENGEVTDTNGPHTYETEYSESGGIGEIKGNYYINGIPSQYQ